MWRRLGSTSKQSVASLEALALFEAYRGQTPAARSLYEEVVSLGRLTGDKAGLLAVLLNFAIVEHTDDNYQRSLELNTEALALARDLGSHRIAVMTQHNMACTLRKMGQVELARQRMEALTPEVLQVDDRNLSMALAEDYAAVLVELGEHARAVRLLGAADTVRERLGVPRDPLQEQELAASIDATRATLTPGEWEDAYQSGRGSSLESALVTAQKS
jgi:tetratricopeptide (TPR) repeat protein